MNGNLKYIAWIVVALVALIALYRVTDIFSPGDDHASISVPTDSGFVPKVKKIYRPASTPFEHPEIPVKRYPQGVKEKDVRRVITIGKLDRKSGIPMGETVRIIETKLGEIYVEKPDSESIQVKEFEYIDPILSWGLFASAGFTLSRKDSRFQFSPAVSISFLRILGNLEVPRVTADLTSVGVGFGYGWNSFVFSIGSHWRFDDQGKQIKLTIQYSFN